MSSGASGFPRGEVDSTIGRTIVRSLRERAAALRGEGTRSASLTNVDIVCYGKSCGGVLDVGLLWESHM